MSYRARIVWIALAGCRGAPPAEVPTNAVSARELADADLVAFDDHDAVFYAARAQGLVEVQRIPMELPIDGPEDVDWLDRETLYVRTDDRVVERVSSSGVFPVVLPPESEFELERLNDDDELGWKQLVVDDDGAWWGECPWGLNADQGFCSAWVWIRIDRDGTRRVDLERFGRSWDWPDDYPDETYVSTPEDLAQPSSLLCESPSGAWTASPGDEDRIGEYAFVSVEPPRLLVSFGNWGDDLFGTRDFELHPGCSPDVVARGRFARPGPRGLWLLDDVVYRGAVPLGRVPRPDSVRFRP